MSFSDLAIQLRPASPKSISRFVLTSCNAGLTFAVTAILKGGAVA
jgi:hypothetical protein